MRHARLFAIVLVVFVAIGATASVARADVVTTKDGHTWSGIVYKFTEKRIRLDTGYGGSIGFGRIYFDWDQIKTIKQSAYAWPNRMREEPKRAREFVAWAKSAAKSSRPNAVPPGSGVKPAAPKQDPGAATKQKGGAFAVDKLPTGLRYHSVVLTPVRLPIETMHEGSVARVRLVVWVNSIPATDAAVGRLMDAIAESWKRFPSSTVYLIDLYLMHSSWAFPRDRRQYSTSLAPGSGLPWFAKRTYAAIAPAGAWTYLPEPLLKRLNQGLIDYEGIEKNKWLASKPRFQDSTRKRQPSVR